MESKCNKDLRSKGKVISYQLGNIYSVAITSRSGKEGKKRQTEPNERQDEDMRPKIRSDHPEECLYMCVYMYVCVGVCESERERANERDLKMAEGQEDIEAITLMKTNEGQSWRERRNVRKGRGERQSKKERKCSVCACVCV